MTDQAIRVVPAGWYEDPASSAHVRWWNGLAWTEHTALKPSTPPQPVAQQPVAQQPAAQQYLQDYTGQSQAGQAGQGQTVTTATGSVYTAETLARIAEARELERQYGISTAEHDVIVGSATHGVDAHGAGARSVDSHSVDSHSGHDPLDAGEYTRSRRARTAPTYDFGDVRTSNASAWFIALWPLLTLVAAIVAAYVYFYVTPEPSVAGIPVVAAVVLIPSLLTLVWALVDARRLRERGHRPASPALALLGPLVYLIARRTRVEGSGPLVTLILLTLVVVGGPVAAHLTGAAAPATKALEIQQAIRAEYVDTGRLASVSCPVFVESLDAGSIYTCNGTLADGTSKRVWVSIEDAAGAFSVALDVR